MKWMITGGPIDHAEPGVDGRGWIWEFRRAGEFRRIFVEISGTALASKSGLAEETAEAISTRGGSVVDRWLDVPDPPRVIKCSTAGCRPAE